MRQRAPIVWPSDASRPVSPVVGASRTCQGVPHQNHVNSGIVADRERSFGNLEPCARTELSEPVAVVQRNCELDAVDDGRRTGELSGKPCGSVRHHPLASTPPLPSSVTVVDRSDSHLSPASFRNQLDGSPGPVEL